MLGPGRVHGIVTWSTALPTSAVAVLSLGVRGSESCAVTRGLWRLRPGGGGRAMEKSRERGLKQEVRVTCAPGAAERGGEQI